MQKYTYAIDKDIKDNSDFYSVSEMTGKWDIITHVLYILEDDYENGSARVDIQYCENGRALIDAIDIEFSLNDGIFTKKGQIDATMGLYKHIWKELENKGWKIE